MRNMPAFLTIPELAERCRVTQTMIVIEIHNGNLAAQTNDGVRVISLESYLNWLERRKARIVEHQQAHRHHRRGIATERRLKKLIDQQVVPNITATNTDDDPFC